MFGLIDWLGIAEGTRPKYIGLIHGLSNNVVVILFIISWFMRLPNPATSGMTAMTLRWIGVGVVLFGSWLGILREGVDDVENGAHR